MEFSRSTKWFKSFCRQRVEKLALFIFARTLTSVSRARKDRFYARLYRSVKHASCERDAEDLFYAKEAKILGEHRHFSYKMWRFCGSSVARLCFQIEVLNRGRGGVGRREFFVLRKRLFDRLCRATNDDDVNNKVKDFFKKVHDEYIGN